MVDLDIMDFSSSPNVSLPSLLDEDNNNTARTKKPKKKRNQEDKDMKTRSVLFVENTPHGALAKVV